MDPALAQAIATLAGAIASAILLWANYRWGKHRPRNDEDDA